MPPLTEKQKEYQRTYYLENREKKLAYLHSWRAKNKDLYQEINRQWHVKNPGRAKVLKRQNYWAKPVWYRLKAKQYSAERKARLTGAGGTCALSAWEGRCAMYLWRCAYCGDTLTAQTVTMDHVIPISKGGPHFPCNLVPACEWCNKSKNNSIWLPRVARERVVAT